MTIKEAKEILKQEPDFTLSYYNRENAIDVVLNELDKLEEYKKIAELTKISCCTAQNCEALNNAIKKGLENQKLKVELDKKDKIINEIAEQLAGYTLFLADTDIPIILKNKKEVIDYFTMKVTKED